MPDSNTDTASVTLQMSSFVINDSTSPVAPFCALSSIAIDASPVQNRLRRDGTLLKVSRDRQANRPLTITFTIQPPPSSPAVSAGVIVLQQTSADGVSDPTGSGHFSAGTPSGNQTSFTDRILGGDPTGSRPTWEYYIPVSRINGSTTEKGWIDPGIVNED